MSWFFFRKLERLIASATNMRSKNSSCHSICVCAVHLLNTDSVNTALLTYFARQQTLSSDCSTPHTWRSTGGRQKRSSREIRRLFNSAIARASTAQTSSMAGFADSSTAGSSRSGVILEVPREDCPTNTEGERLRWQQTRVLRAEPPVVWPCAQSVANPELIFHFLHNSYSYSHIEMLNMHYAYYLCQ